MQFWKFLLNLNELKCFRTIVFAHKFSKNILEINFKITIKMFLEIMTLNSKKLKAT